MLTFFSYYYYVTVSRGSMHFLGFESEPFEVKDQKTIFFANQNRPLKLRDSVVDMCTWYHDPLK